MESLKREVLTALSGNSKVFLRYHLSWGCPTSRVSEKMRGDLGTWGLGNLGTWGSGE